MSTECGGFIDSVPAMYAADEVHHLQATSYCLHGQMADGTSTRKRSAASNELPLGKKIRLVGEHAGPGGIRKYVIRDRIGWGTRLDLWHGSCNTASQFGRRPVSFILGWRR